MNVSKYPTHSSYIEHYLMLDFYNTKIVGTYLQPYIDDWLRLYKSFHVFRIVTNTDYCILLRGWFDELVERMSAIEGIDRNRLATTRQTIYNVYKQNESALRNCFSLELLDQMNYYSNSDIYSDYDRDKCWVESRFH